MSDLTIAQPNELNPAPAADLLVEGSEVRGRIDAMDLAQIEQRRNEILTSAQGNYESLSTEMLHELAYIASRLRRTNVGPPKEAKVKKAAKKGTIDDIL